ncbi:GCR1-dependent translation factor [Hirsutella rhossiliensis]|uniref:GCR1-dependent translation factor n=1 Tax=Hirsutella rhossiliensis TaxID=111463 RepID=A0A9P8N055_9HYPO|nr:GCR1-dependent translation factor [Hirsutella rhossiliensis]KAH0964177.1 GCR1-dependent translation factor [Hirsutella rhossiliensis]
MKLRAKPSALPLLLLLPSLAVGLANDGLPSSPAALKPRHDLPSRAAPIDGKDGKPHSGPFVETDGTATDSDNNELPPLKGRPHDPTVVDGKRIPESNDGVMFDKNRERPQQGTTGMEGGVSEKANARKAQEGQTGEKVLTQPQSPKEQPPLPHSEEQKIQTGDDKDKERTADKDKSRSKPSSDKNQDKTDYTGLDRPNLPDAPGEKSNPLPKSAVKDHLSPSKPSVDTTRTGHKLGQDKDDDGLIQPLHSFVLSLTMILVSEVGDKTFLVAALMAMKHDRLVVFSAAYGALLVMTVLSAVLGHAVPTLIPKRLTSLLAAVLFLVFGAKLLREGMKMDPDEGVSAEMHEVEQELAEKEKEHGHQSRDGISPHSLEMGLKGRGGRPKGRFPTPPRSPSQSPSRSPSRGSRPLANFVHGISNLCSLLLSPAWVQTFVMTFLGEWGDRSQIATIAMAAGQDYWWVTLGAMCGHAVCTGVAVVGGRAIAGRVSLKVVTVGGAVAFLLFAFIYLLESLHA